MVKTSVTTKQLMEAIKDSILEKKMKQNKSQ